MVRAAAAAVFSRGLRHVSLCFNRRSELSGHRLVANSAASLRNTCASSYFFSSAIVAATCGCGPDLPTKLVQIGLFARVA